MLLYYIIHTVQYSGGEWSLTPFTIGELVRRHLGIMVGAIRLYMLHAGDCGPSMSSYVNNYI